MKYRKKPVTIDAVQWVNDNASLNAIVVMMGHAPAFAADGTGDLVIRSLEGDMQASVGDWIIRGIRGELYPCKPDIFDATYEAVSPDVATRDDWNRRAIPPNVQKVIEEMEKFALPNWVDSAVVQKVCVPLREWLALLRGEEK